MGGKKTSGSWLLLLWGEFGIQEKLMAGGFGRFWGAQGLKARPWNSDSPTRRKPTPQPPAPPPKKKTHIPFTLYNRDPYIVHLNIALYMMVSPYFGGKKHVLNAQNVSFKEPCTRSRASSPNPHPPTQGCLSWPVSCAPPLPRNVQMFPWNF